MREPELWSRESLAPLGGQNAGRPLHGFFQHPNVRAVLLGREHNPSMKQPMSPVPAGASENHTGTGSFPPSLHTVPSGTAPSGRLPPPAPSCPLPFHAPSSQPPPSLFSFLPLPSSHPKQEQRRSRSPASPLPMSTGLKFSRHWERPTTAWPVFQTQSWMSLSAQHPSR